MKKSRIKIACGFLAVFFMLGAPRSASAYSVLSHEAVVDALWQTSIRSLILKRFPGATPDQLHEAHAYVYGGCIIQDMGY